MRILRPLADHGPPFPGSPRLVRATRCSAYTPPVEPILRPPAAFAHRGGRAHAPENTLEAFGVALQLGAPGLESDVWLTADGVPVLDHDGRVRRGLRRRPLSAFDRKALPAHIASLEDLYAASGSAFELSLDVNDPDAFEAVLDVARAAGPDVEGRLWLCHPDWELLARWRESSPRVRLVNSTRLYRLPQGPERRAAQLADAGIDGVNLHRSEWTGGLTTLFHRFGRLALAWDAQHERELRALLRMGVDGVYSDHVDRMLRALAEARS